MSDVIEQYDVFFLFSLLGLPHSNADVCCTGCMLHWMCASSAYVLVLAVWAKKEFTTKIFCYSDLMPAKRDL